MFRRAAIRSLSEPVQLEIRSDKQRQQDVFYIELGVPLLLYDVLRVAQSFLGLFGKSVARGCHSPVYVEDRPRRV